MHLPWLGLLEVPAHFLIPFPSGQSHSSHTLLHHLLVFSHAVSFLGIHFCPLSFWRNPPVNFKLQPEEPAIRCPPPGGHCHCFLGILWWLLVCQRISPPRLCSFERQGICLLSHCPQQPAESRTWGGSMRYCSQCNEPSFRSFRFFIGEHV